MGKDRETSFPGLFITSLETNRRGNGLHLELFILSVSG